jgi:hypothetical protein
MAVQDEQVAQWIGEAPIAELQWARAEIDARLRALVPAPPVPPRTVQFNVPHRSVGDSVTWVGRTKGVRGSRSQKTGTILKVGQTRYHVRCDQDGLTWTLPFSMATDPQ